MREELTEIVVVLDESGSMDDIKDDVTRSYNRFLDEQKKVSGEAIITLVKFNTDVKFLYNRVNINAEPQLDKSNYNPDGSTALYDAVGKSIDDLGIRLASLDESQRPRKVMMVIITDGEENASREYTSTRIKEMVEHQTTKYGWQFLFLAANQDAALGGSAIGIQYNSCINFEATAQGVSELAHIYSGIISKFRMS